MFASMYYLLYIPLMAGMPLFHDYFKYAPTTRAQKD